MSNTKSFNDKLNGWQALVDNLTPHLADLPNLAADHGTLSTLVSQTRALQAQQDIHLADLRDVVTQRNVLAVQARKARNRLAAGLQSAFDHENDKLLEFGIRPRSRQSNLRLTKLQKAENAATRAVARAAELAAAKQPAGQPGAPPPTAGFPPESGRIFNIHFEINDFKLKNWISTWNPLFQRGICFFKVEFGLLFWNFEFHAEKQDFRLEFQIPP